MTTKDRSNRDCNGLTTDPLDSPQIQNRRKFLHSISSAAATGAAAVVAAGPVGAKEVAASNKLVVGVSRVRSVAARSVRVTAAVNQFRTPTLFNRANSDEGGLPNFIGSFTKTLPHNGVGEVDANAFRALKVALQSRNDADWENLNLSPQASRKLANPQASLAFGLSGGDCEAFFMPPAPTFASAQQAAEMAEVYWHAVLRDVPFDDYQTHLQAELAAADLNTFSDFKGPREGPVVTPATLFRGSSSGNLIGNYLSQFLLLPIPQGAALTEQRYQTSVPGDDHMTNRADWLNILRGGEPTTMNRFEGSPKFITTARDLGEYVHRDYPYQTYLQAALILLGSGTPLQNNNPYNSSANQEGFVTFGLAELLSQIGTVADSALKAAWFQKWQVHRRLRPEVFGGRVHFTMTGERAYPIHPELLNSPVLEAVTDANNGEFWLPMAYPEGSPTHPAYPAGHAVVAGACITVLKAFFDGSSPISQPLEVIPGSAGEALQAYSGSEMLTVDGELNKLANNIAIGRNLAGVHWRTDGAEGILLGEDVAVRMLRDAKLTHPEASDPIELTGFRGNTISI